MPLFESEGIVLQSRSFSETSKILVVFTKERGVVSVLVKGGRKGTKKFPGGLETLNCIDIQYYYKQSRELQNFKSFDLIESFQGIRQDLPRLFTALSLAETVLRCTASEDKNEDLYVDIITALEVLNNQQKNPWCIRWKALLNFSKCLGFGIALEGCNQCGTTTEITHFDLENGGFRCLTHSEEHPSIISISGETWGTLRFLGQCHYEAASRMAVSPFTGRRTESLFRQYYLYHIPGLKNLESWKKLPDVYWAKEE